MPFSLSDKEKRAIARIIQEGIDKHLSRFPFARYPIEPLEEWKRAFVDPKTIPIEMLRKAFRWPFGGWARNDLPTVHSRTIISIIKSWPEFSESPAFEPEQAFRFWEQRLPHWHSGFNATSFLLHLMRPDMIENADIHRVRAMSELMKTAGVSVGDQSHPLSFTTLEQYSQFFRLILPKMPYGTESRIKLDRFLKGYGNRHAYRNVAEEYLTQEPTIREFSWEKASSKQFDIGKIRLRSNADIMFACLLLSLEQYDQKNTLLTIGRITEHIPLGTAGICNPASYNYAMISLFGRQKGRDYFQLESTALQEAFTEQANQSTRDMKFYEKHADEDITINPKYYKKK
ncbi:hypothetical protein D3C74_200640 [compost metagenome]